VTYRPASLSPDSVPATAIPARLKPDAIGVAQDTIIGMANAAPTVSVGLTLATLAATAAYGSGPVILLCFAPMLVIANAYRRLNLWTPNCGASFEWVGRAINPYLGFFAGWLMITGNFAGTSAGIVVLAPSILAVFGNNAASTWPNIAIATAVIVVMLVIAIAGIRLTARTQLGMGLIEYAILIGFAIAGFVAVIGHHPGTFPISSGWFSVTGIGGKGDLAGGLLIAVFMYTGWDATVYVNEEVRGRRPNPGLSAILAVAFLTIIFVVAEMGLQGMVSPARLQANASSALVFVAQALGGSGWAKVMAFSLALSVIATTGTGIVILARILYGMASHRVLPSGLGRINVRYSTPVIASVLVGLIFVAIIWVYLLSSSVATVFTDLINVTGILYASFYGLTALSAVVYYRRRVFSDVFDAVVIGILPFAAAGFLVWIMIKTLQTAPSAQLWTLASVGVAGVLLMLIARFVMRSSFFQLPRESAARKS
jgi:amino acid transporter